MMDLAWMRGQALEHDRAWRWQQAFEDGRRCHEWIFQNFEATIMMDEDLDEIYKELLHKFVHR
jgi:hypothetical protein